MLFKKRYINFFQIFTFPQFFYVASLKTTCHKVVNREFNIVFLAHFLGVLLATKTKIQLMWFVKYMQHTYTPFSLTVGSVYSSL